MEMNRSIRREFSLILLILIYLSYFIGFYLNENSAGSGGYDGDLKWIWRNFEIFKSHSFLDSINSKEFFGNRTPLMYLVNVQFNPFVNNIDSYRLSIFIFSLLGPIFFYHCLKLKFKKVEKTNLMLIASTIILSPYYRTTAYWGMEINYSIITMIITYYFYLKNDLKKNNIFYLIFTILFSSLTIYFDQKFLFLPIFILFKILLSEINYKYKWFSIFLYFILSLPYLYLLTIWKGIVPPLTQERNTITITNLSRLNLLHMEQIGYASTIIAFYIFPILFLLKKNFTKILTNFFNHRFNITMIILFFIYLLYVILNLKFDYYTGEKYSIYNFGLGVVHKLSILLFEDQKIREIFTYISFILSWFIILILINKELNNFLFIIYFFLLSLFVFPIMQEYFDLVIIIIALILFKIKIKINNLNTNLFVGYFVFYLILCNLYY